MFAERITSTPLSVEMADVYFKDKITGDAWRQDVSFLSSLRAILVDRIGDGKIKFRTVRNTINSPCDMADSDVVSAVVSGLGLSGRSSVDTLTLVDVAPIGGDPAQNAKKVYDALVSEFTNHFSGWTNQEKTAFFRQFNKDKNLYVTCFINERKRASVVVVCRMGLQVFHLLQAGIYQYIPWFFKDVTADEAQKMELMKFAKIFTSGALDDYNACIASVAERIDFRSAYIKDKIGDFEKREVDRMLERKRREIEKAERGIERLRSSHAEYMRTIREANIYITGLAQKDTNTSELVDYFIANKRLFLESIDDSEINFIVEDYLDYYDEDEAEAIINNQRSYVGRGGQMVSDIFRAVFIDHLIKIRFCCSYTLSIGSGVSGNQHHRYPEEILARSAPNPHIDRYSCLGDYRDVIDDALLEGDYVCAIEQCVASAKSLNFGDSIVMSEFVERVRNNSDNACCFELPDGRVVKPKDAWEWIKAQRAQAEVQ